MRKAIVIGASSGIGRELAKMLAANGYSLGLAARRVELLRQLQQELPVESHIGQIDVGDVTNAQQGLGRLIAKMGGVDLMIISAGVGHLNPHLALAQELETIATNVTGFTVMANVAFNHFLSRGSGHLVAITSIAAIRGSGTAPAYNASKAFVANYLQGLRQKAAQTCPAIVVTDIQPGFVATAMAKGDGLFWVAPPSKAAMQIYAAIERKGSHAYITRRWRLIAWLLKGMPSFVYHRL